MSVKIERVYGSKKRANEKRFLVDGLWPRGVKKESLALDGWLKELAPSAALRKWFGHDPARWAEFQRRYRAELGDPAKRAALSELASLARTKTVVLLFGARDEEHNQAVVLRDALQELARR